jgi:hypothetical protein
VEFGEYTQPDVIASMLHCEFISVKLPKGLPVLFLVRLGQLFDKTNPPCLGDSKRFRVPRTVKALGAGF